MGAAKGTTHGVEHAGADAGPHPKEHPDIVAPLRPSASGGTFEASCSDHMQINKLIIK